MPAKTRSGSPTSARVLALALLCLLPAAGCGPARQGQVGRSTSPPAKLEIRQARALLTPGMGAAYFTVINPGPEKDRLLRVETSAARIAETHESVDENGMMRMVARPEGFEVPAGGTLELQPGGKHVMLMETRPAADAAGEIPLTLFFERSGRIEVRASVLGGPQS